MKAKMGEEVKVHGMWASPYSCRVKWALELKGIPYQYVEEDISNKSPSLLQYNPLHKKVPVLVHGGTPICESMIILEYIDETWPHNPPLFPNHPLDRASARFWIKYFENKDFGGRILFGSGSGEEQEKAVAEGIQMLRTIEDQCLRDNKFFGGDQIGAVDLAFGGIAHWLGVLEQVSGVKLLSAEEFPRLYAWTKAFKESPAIRSNLPDAEKLAELFKRRHEQLLQSP